MGSGQSTDAVVQETATSMKQQLLPSDTATAVVDQQTPQQNPSNTKQPDTSVTTTTTTAPTQSTPVTKKPTTSITTTTTTTTSSSNVPLPSTIGASPSMTDNIISKSDIENYFKTDFEIRIDPLIFQINKEIIQLRRYFHEHPELSFKEFETSNSISKFLKSREIEVYENIGKTGVVGVLRGTGGDNSNSNDSNNNNEGRCIMLRADMDALPVLEGNDVGYKSKNVGVMHACGHDCHMAILLSVARILTKEEYCNKIDGIVKFCFQPGEEGYAGAKAMIEDGVLEADEKNNIPRVDQVYGLHVWSYEKFGKCVVRDGPLMAGSSPWFINITGKGGHGAEPKGTNDAIVAATQTVLQLHTIISRNLSPLEEGVLTVGTIKSGDRGNIIAETASLSGTMRWYDNEVMERIKSRMKQILTGIESSFQVKTELKFGAKPYPPTINNYECTLNVAKAVSSVLPEGGCMRSEPTMAAEDFSMFLNERPGNYFFLNAGVNDENNPDAVYAHHKPNFKIDERCLVVGVQIMVNLILDLLKPRPKIQENNQQDTENNQNGNEQNSENTPVTAGNGVVNPQ